jgi:pimeloyl-ACP methyl ester carboxylesterase
MASSKTTWRSEALGPASSLGRLRAHVTGEGPPLVFAHGLLVNANLWRNVVARLADRFQCVTLDLPLGSHVEPVGDSPLTPTDLADLVADAIDELGRGPVTLVGNDTGGGISQILAARRPELIDRLVLTSSDAYDVFPPKLFAYLKPFGRAPGAIPLAFGAMRWRPLRRLPIAFGWVTKRPIDRDAEDSYVLPVLTNAGVRSDLAKVIRGLDPRYTLEAAERLRTFHRPVLIAWSDEERVFPRHYAERLRDDLPEATLEWIEDAYTFSPEDNPEAVARSIAAFLPTTTAQRS